MRSASLLVIPAVVAAVASFTGCNDASTNGASPDGGASPDAAVSTCAPIEGDGTVHGGGALSTDDETWTAAGSPHVLDFGLTIREGQKLTIEPCAVVRVRKGTAILVQGALVAEGAADRPIRFERADANDPWKNIETRENSEVRLAHASLVGGGFTNGDRIETVAMFDVRGNQDAPPKDNVRVEDVTLDGSASLGLLLREGGSLATGSRGLTITGGAAAPIRSWARAAGSLPQGTYTGNQQDEILLTAEGSRDAVREDMTLADRGVPYHVVGSELLVGYANTADAPKATLTIEAGVTLRFAKGSRLSVDAYATDKPAVGALRALGTADAPVVFTSAEEAPAAGDWVGITFKGAPDPNDRIDHAVIAYAGGDSGISSYDCPYPEKKTFSNYGAIIVFGQQPTSGFVTNTAFENSNGDGVVRGWTGDPVDFLATNTFSGIALCNQTFPKPKTTTCPEEPLCPKN